MLKGGLSAVGISVCFGCFLSPVSARWPAALPDSTLADCQLVPRQCFPLLCWFFYLLPKIPPSSFCQLSTFNSFSHAASTFPGSQPANKSLHRTRDTCKMLSLAGRGNCCTKMADYPAVHSMAALLHLTRWPEEKEHYILHRTYKILAFIHTSLLNLSTPAMTTLSHTFKPIQRAEGQGIVLCLG